MTSKIKTSIMEVYSSKRSSPICSSNAGIFCWLFLSHHSRLKGVINMLRGVAGAPGIAIGRAFVFRPEQLEFERKSISSRDVDQELVKLQHALRQAHQELSSIYARALSDLGRDRAGTFHAQIMILEDATFESELINVIRSGVNVEGAVGEVVTSYVNIFEDSRDEYLRERAADYRDVGCRLLRILLGQSWTPVPRLKEEAIVVARDLSAPDSLQLDRSRILGLATESGGRTSTACILARSLEIPAVVGLGRFVHKVQSGDLLIVDGSKGTVIINPNEATVAEYRHRRETYLACRKELQMLSDLPAETRDGYRVQLLANIDHPGEVTSALAQGAEGVGLFRTEHLFLGRDTMPSEDEQFAVYVQVVQKTGGRCVVIRTLDYAGPSSPFFQSMHYEPNPFLGCRGIRLNLNFEEIFKVQIKAILRAGAYGKVKVMFPLISRVEDLRRAKDMLQQAQLELEQEGKKFDPRMEVGLLVEVPSAALTAELFAPEIDFYNIGTNDLVQYTLAVDRTSARVNPLHQALHPAVLRLVKNVIDAARNSGKCVAMCGEMAGEPLATLLLLGLGLQQFSAAAGSLPEIKKVIRAVTLREAREVAHRALQLSAPEEVRRYLEQEMKSRRLYF
ncbi:phosphoenolpyruvate--protein phosphotransferase [Desulfofundulus thermobenzoicus]|uniref:Phosphoenolpyruvate-protein phosphotransferase n=2 Tax=Desulfofundulus thermobenzoicus TaxID=29376 RepID=A0A6N7IMB4_9FIRM|nr:phosphoenolpyruvate--protein phosphotransferase [Desulfofundulus thermobenzoicus]